jgi:hypothetical protein
MQPYNNSLHTKYFWRVTDGQWNGHNQKRLDSLQNIYRGIDIKKRILKNDGKRFL